MLLFTTLHNISSFLSVFIKRIYTSKETIMATTDKSSLLFKELMGTGESNTTRQFFEEPINGRRSILTNQILTEFDLVPIQAPILVNGAKDGVVQYFDKLSLTPVPGTTNAFYHTNLKNCVPFNFGNGSYNYKLYDASGNAIPAGMGEWMVQDYSGMLVFYGTVPPNLPPRISFYSYIGKTGLGANSVTRITQNELIHVAPTNHPTNPGDDVNGDGSFAKPFATLSRAYKVLESISAGSSVIFKFLGAGNYSLNNEVFELPLVRPKQLTIKFMGETVNTNHAVSKVVGRKFNVGTAFADNECIGRVINLGTDFASIVGNIGSVVEVNSCVDFTGNSIISTNRTKITIITNIMPGVFDTTLSFENLNIEVAEKTISDCKNINFTKCTVNDIGTTSKYGIMIARVEKFISYCLHVKTTGMTYDGADYCALYLTDVREAIHDISVLNLAPNVVKACWGVMFDECSTTEIRNLNVSNFPIGVMFNRSYRMIKHNGYNTSFVVSNAVVAVGIKRSAYISFGSQVLCEFGGCKYIYAPMNLLYDTRIVITKMISEPSIMYVMDTNPPTIQWNSRNGIITLGKIPHAQDIDSNYNPYLMIDNTTGMYVAIVGTYPEASGQLKYKVSANATTKIVVGDVRYNTALKIGFQYSPIGVMGNFGDVIINGDDKTDREPVIVEYGEKKFDMQILFNDALFYNGYVLSITDLTGIDSAFVISTNRMIKQANASLNE